MYLGKRVDRSPDSLSNGGRSRPLFHADNGWSAFGEFLLSAKSTPVRVFTQDMPTGLLTWRHMMEVVACLTFSYLHEYLIHPY